MNMTDYEQTRRSFRLDVPAGFNFTRDVVEARAAREPGLRRWWRSTRPAASGAS